MTTLWFEQALLPDGWTRHVRIAITGELIVSVEANTAPQPGDERHAVAIPGLANLHSHAFQRGMAGLAERRGARADSFWTWRETMYRFANAILPEQMQAIAAQAFCEMLESGFTHVGEFHYIHHAPDGSAYAEPAEMGLRIAAAAREAGLGLTLLPVLYAASGFDGAALKIEQQRFANSLDNYAALVERTRSALRDSNTIVGVAPHSLRAVTPELLAGAVEIAGDAPIHIHIAEQQGEVDTCLAWSGRRPVEWLLGSAPVDERWCLVHATHITGNEAGMIARSGAVAGLCPITEANLGDGIFPASAFLKAGGRIGIGSDSNVRIDAAEELRSLEYSQRLLHQARNVLTTANCASTGRRLFDAALSGGAQAMGIVATGLASGAAANIVALDAHHPTLFGKTGDQLLDSWIFAGGREMIDSVWAKGKRCVTGGRHLNRDGIEARYRSALKALA